jgi:aryl-alcohol dehydrogenase-like predicted oxidoreductase
MTNTQTSLLGDKPVRRIGFGAMQLAGPGVFGPPRDPDAARAVLRRAIELGIDHIDTAQYYGPDVVNDLICETLWVDGSYPEGLRLVTKVGGRRDSEGGWLPARTPAELRAGVEDNLRSLRVERMDLVNLRLMGSSDSSDSSDSSGSLGEPDAEQLGELADLRREGKLDLIGVSNVSVDGFRTALELVGVEALGDVQNPYSILDRADDELVDLCEQREVAYVPFFPLGSAFTGGQAALGADAAIASVARRHEATPSQIALAWLLHRSPRILLIPGTSSVSHLEENVAAGELALDAEDMAALDGVEQVGVPRT